MGRNSLIYKSLKRIIIKEEENNRLSALFEKFRYNQYDFIGKNHLQTLLDLSDPELFDIIFNLFNVKFQRYRVLYFKNLRELYYCFISDDFKVKIGLISFIVFKNNDKLEYNEISENIKKFFKNSVLEEVLERILELNNDKTNTKKNNNSITRKEFYYLCKKEANFFKYYYFINNRSIIGSSECPLSDNDLNYVCDCDVKRYNFNINDFIDSMKSGFDSLTKNTKEILYLSDFRKLMIDANINDKMISLVIEYIRKITQKDYCSFSDIKYIFLNLNYSVPFAQKKRFLFKMILTICGKDNKVTLKQLFEYLDFNCPKKEEKKENDNKNQIIDETKTPKNKEIEIKTDEINTDSKNINENMDENMNENKILDEIKTEKQEFDDINENENEIPKIDEKKLNISIGEEDFMKDDINSNDNTNDISKDIYNDLVIKIIPHLNQFGLLPYLLFKAHTKNKKIKRTLIKDYLKKRNIENHEKFLEENFDKCNSFFIIDINFWNSLMDENSEMPDYINNSRIAEEEEIIMKEEDKFYQEENEEKMKEYEEKHRKDIEKMEKMKNKMEKKKDGDNNENKKDENNQEQNKKNVINIEEITTKRAKLKKV